MNKDKLIRNSIIGIFVALYAIVSVISTIHVIDFFQLTNPRWLAISLAVAFEVGAAASLAAIIILDKTSRSLVWFLFILLTAMQAMGNMYYAYDNANGYETWMELFALNEEEPIYQKRILAIISGAILPLVALGFIKSLVDYIRPAKKEENLIITTEGKVGSDIQNPEEKLEVLPTEQAIEPEPIVTKEYVDEQAIFDEVNSEPSSAPDVIQTVKDETMNDTINEIKELTEAEDDIKIDREHTDAKARVIQEVRNEEYQGNIENTHVVEDPGNGSTTKRNFGPPDINNGVIQ